MRFNLEKIQSDVDEELQFHIEMLEQNYAQQGMSAADAQAAALRRFGKLEKVKKQCVDISQRNNHLRRGLKVLSVLLVLTGIVVHLLGSDYKVVRIGHVLIMIAIAGRLLLYVRGLAPSTFLPHSNETRLSVVPEDRTI